MAKRLTTKADVLNAYIGGETLVWEDIHQKVRDISVDLRYVGVYMGSDDSRGNTRALTIPAVHQDIEEGLTGRGSHFHRVMRDDILWKSTFKVDESRFTERNALIMIKHIINIIYFIHNNNIHIGTISKYG